MSPRAFTRDFDLPGWSRQSGWGYDELLECYWANLWRDDDRFDSPRIAISSYHLIPTPTALARVIADYLGIDDAKAYLALVGHSPLNRVRSSSGSSGRGR
jgi:hypothetical protein